MAERKPLSLKEGIEWGLVDEEALAALRDEFQASLKGLLPQCFEAYKGGLEAEKGVYSRYGEELERIPDHMVRMNAADRVTAQVMGKPGTQAKPQVESGPDEMIIKLEGISHASEA